METYFANSGKVIEYKGTQHKILRSGISIDGIPFVELEPMNEELVQRMINEIATHGNLKVHFGGIDKLVLGRDEYPYW